MVKELRRRNKGGRDQLNIPYRACAWVLRTARRAFTLLKLCKGSGHTGHTAVLAHHTLAAQAEERRKVWSEILP